MIRLVDVSAVQGKIDWPAVAAADIRGAYLKCTDGNSPGCDARFRENLERASGAGVAVGAYHFAFPLPSHAPGDGRTAREQAQRAFAQSHGLGSMPGELPPALDLEWPEPTVWRKWGCSPAQILDWGIAYLEEAARLWRRPPIVYTYPWFWGSCDGGTRKAYADYPLWLADYNLMPGRIPTEGDRPRHVGPWETWTLWQHDGTGGLRLPGAGQDADFDVFNGDAEAFARFCGVLNSPAPAGP